MSLYVSIEGYLHHPQIDVFGNFGYLIMLTPFLSYMAAISINRWRPAPWYSWIWEAGDDEYGLL